METRETNGEGIIAFSFWLKLKNMCIIRKNKAGENMEQYCSKCGTKLEIRELDKEGQIPYCPSCEEFRFPPFNSAVSMIALNPKKDRILLIQQYGKKNYILVAGYVNKGECLEETVAREMKEEIGRTVVQCQYLKSSYFSRTNTLMNNFLCVLDSEDLSMVNQEEVDLAKWFTFEEAYDQVKPQSLAQQFLHSYLKKNMPSKTCL